VIGVSLNFRSHLEQLRFDEPPKTPVLFLKPENCITGHLSPVPHPAGVQALQPGPSLAVVIGETARRVRAENALSIVKGYTLFNDFSLPEASYFRPPVRTKCFDSSGPLGPVVVGRDDLPEPHDVTLECRVNGELRQKGNTRDLVWRIPELLESITSFMTLHENDVIATGFPPGRVDVRAGDTVTVAADGIGELTNTLVPETQEDPTLAGGIPTRQRTILALGLNYRDHASELDLKAPEAPLLFLKAPSSLTGHEGLCRYPEGASYLHYEGELVVVMGRVARKLTRHDAMDYISGYTIANDYAVRDYLENYYRPNLRAKSRDSLTPLGPGVVDAKDIEDPHSLSIRTYVNGELRQEGSTRDMVFDIPALLEHVTGFMTLRPGDLILTGTPKGVSPVVPGDEVVVEVEGIGRLASRIVPEPPRADQG
jgi:5-oxopent-3-ene-1,2,5-tricarboxylate decarboxylase/2-hydroxyhepta-2,4-diene-1,7-dioate isomerase